MNTYETVKAILKNDPYILESLKIKFPKATNYRNIFLLSLGLTFLVCLLFIRTPYLPRSAPFFLLPNITFLILWIYKHSESKKNREQTLQTTALNLSEDIKYGTGKFQIEENHAIYYLPGINPKKIQLSLRTLSKLEEERKLLAQAEEQIDPESPLFQKEVRRYTQ